MFGLTAHVSEPPEYLPHWAWCLPFIILLVLIGLLPLFRPAMAWWHRNRNKLLLSAVLGLVVCGYYLFRPHGLHGAEPGVATLLRMLNHAVLVDYLPFIVLLFSLYTITGGINLRGDIPAHPVTNTTFLAIGTLLASLLGTTGVSMLLIRPLLQINSDRKHVRHTVVFFIFLVCNIGGCLLPIGDPPLFLGYLRGVPFFWTLRLLPHWAFASLVLLAVYFLWDSVAWRRESRVDTLREEVTFEPFRLEGKHNFLYLFGVVLAVVLLVPGKPIPGTEWRVPHLFLREIAQLALAFLSYRHTRPTVRDANSFNFFAIAEVACLFIGIFITVQIPMEILAIEGPRIGLTRPWEFFWASGMISSFLDNAPTYIVFFSTASSLRPEGMEMLELISFATNRQLLIPAPYLVAISCGAVFMGAFTYIGNGPNFMVKSIAEQSGIRMPSFFGFLLYSMLILLPLFVVLTLIFFA